MQREGIAYTANGFTEVELVITMVISSLVVSAIYSTFTKQLEIATSQDQVLAMQQNIRAASNLLSRQIRMAGYDLNKTANAGFKDAVSFSNGATMTTQVFTNGTQISFTADLDNDGTIDQAPEDINGDGNNDLTEMEQISFRLNGTNLQIYSTRTGAIAWQTVAENIARIEFCYRDTNGVITANLANIRSVQVSILAITGQSDRNFIDTQTYTTASGVVWGPFNDNYRRRFFSQEIVCRNMGV